MNSVCYNCIEESYLREQIAKNGVTDRCLFCLSTENQTIELDELAEQIHVVLDEHFLMTSPDPEGPDLLAAKEGHWEQPGDPVTYVIADLIGSSEELAKSILEYLSNTYDPYGKDALTEPCPYAEESQYEARPVDTYEFQESWTSFREEILSRSRFFNQAAKSALDHLFDGVGKLVTYGGKPVVRSLGTSDSIFRARLAKSIEDLESILASVPRSLGAPPGSVAKAGRMNAEGISVFYGATDMETCVAEIRAPVGSDVVIARFSPTRELRVLDLTTLREVFLQGSLFDSEYTESLSRVHFLRKLEAEISQPVMPGSESRDYLPTQVVAEYLRAHPEMQLDGIMFSSSQFSIKEKNTVDSKNLVLFAHCCELESHHTRREKKVDVHFFQNDPEEEDYSILILETEEDKSKEEGTEDLLDNDSARWHSSHSYFLPEETANPSIRMDMNSIEVRRIKGVSYQTSSFNVSWHHFDPNVSDF